MKEYEVLLPITGHLVVSVEAESKEEAVKKAMEEGTIDDLESWSATEIIVEGNIFSGELNEVEVMRVDGEDDEEDYSPRGRWTR